MTGRTAVLAVAVVLVCSGWPLLAFVVVKRKMFHALPRRLSPGRRRGRTLAQRRADRAFARGHGVSRRGR